MADIRVTSTGKVFYKVDDCTAALLLEALPASFERYKPAAPPVQTVPIFYSAPSEYTARIGIFVKLPSGEVRSAFDVADKRAAEKMLSAGEIPEQEWQKYVARSGVSGGLSEADRNADAARRHREEQLTAGFKLG
jgi:hypothetical protein